MRQPIVGYEGKYEIVANLGVWNIRFNKPLRWFLNIDGYAVVGLFKNKKQRQFFIHRLIAEAFIPNPEKKPFINHKNGIKTDFSIQNLEWCTQSENQLHAYRTGLQIGYGVSGEKAGKARLTLDTNTGIFYGCLKDAAFARGLNPASVVAAIQQGRNKTGLVYV